MGGPNKTGGTMSKKKNIFEAGAATHPKRMDGGEREVEATKLAVNSVADMVDVLLEFAHRNHKTEVNEFAHAMRTNQAQLRVTLEFDHNGLLLLKLFD